jgi:endonuclease YncB( thermonuclease family)
MSRKAEGGSRRFLTGMVFGIALGVVVAKMLGELPRQAWERVFSLTSGAEEEARAVRKVIDGDTIVLEPEERVRYIGVDAPELGEPLSIQAKEFQEEMVHGSRVRVDVCKEEPRDGYGRTLAFVHKGGVDVGAELLGQGLARTLFVGPCGRALAREYRKVEREAFRAGRGIWSLQDPRCVDHGDAGRYIGCLISVTGKVVEVHAGPRAFHLNFGADHRKDFTAVIFRRDLPRLIKEGLVPVTEFEGRVVEVTGILEEYNGPEIIVESADQLVLSPRTP